MSMGKRSADTKKGSILGLAEPPLTWAYAPELIDYATGLRLAAADLCQESASIDIVGSKAA
jgi:hypothetical protein